jgi:hypothetical protein
MLKENQKQFNPKIHHIGFGYVGIIPSLISAESVSPSSTLSS